MAANASRKIEKITLGEMRSSGVRGLLIYCSDYRCSHYIAISGDRWPDDVRLSDLEPLFTCTACGTKGADVRPDFNWYKQDALARRFRRPFLSPGRESLWITWKNLALHGI